MLKASSRKPFFQELVESTLCLFLVFVFHRSMYLPFILENHTDLIFLTKTLLVGLTSDLWVSALLSLALIAFKLLFFPCPQIIRRAISLIIYGMCFLLIAAHQPYIEFFRVPFVSFHLPYMVDFDFLSANFKSVGNPRFFILLAVGLFINGWLHRTRFRRKEVGGFYFAIMMLSIAGHVFHLKYRVQWHVPLAMQANFVESYYIQITQITNPQPFSNSETKLIQSLHNSHTSKAEAISTWYKSSSFHSTALPLLLELRKQFLTKISKQEKPLILIYLMESFRNTDHGSGPNGEPSLTPHYDTFSETGINFLNAYSAGTVTRGGQEAVLCGFPGALSTSTMRNRSEIHLPCITDLSSAHTYWYHGGEGRFDNQLAFWRRHGVEDLLSIQDFPPETSRTGWGIGDISFVRRALNRLETSQAVSNANHSIGMFLSITNHIPWDIPNDGEDLSFPRAQINHPSAKTVHYADQAFGNLIEGLKQKGMWQQAIVIALGDHGIHAPSLNYEDISNEEQLSHIALSIGGGIVETALKNLGLKNFAHTEPTSQTSVASFIAFVSGLKDGLYFTQPLLSKSVKPVLSDLGDRIYIPASNSVLGYRDVLTKAIDSLPEIQQLPAFHYRQFRLDLEEWSLHSHSKDNFGIQSSIPYLEDSIL